MDDDFSSLDALVKSLKTPAPRPSQGIRRREVERTPDALVLGMVRTTCTCCGSVTEYPSSHLLLRFGRDYKWSAATLESGAYGDVPLETKYVEAQNAHCAHCWPTEATRAPDSSRMWQKGLRLNCEPLHG